MMKTYEEIIKLSNSHPIIIFDGVCKFCNAWVNFIIKRDDDKLFRFAPLQSETGQIINKKLQERGSLLDSVILINKGQFYTKSEVAFALIDYLPSVYKPLKIFRFFPLSFRDWVYDFIASVRYKIFGKKDKCEIPNKDLLQFYIDY